MLTWIRISNILTLLILGAALCHAAEYTQGNAEVGKEKSQACVACHGPDGNGPLAIYPKIAGQNQRYFIEQMLDFKQGKKSGRDNAIMHALTTNLSEQDIADLAAYFAMQHMSSGKAKPSLVQLGTRIYRGGVRTKGIPACSACHGPQGLGNAQAGFPALGGQYAAYTRAQLNAYRDNKRQNDINNIMQSIAKKMSPEEIQAVASYIEGLH